VCYSRAIPTLPSAAPRAEPLDAVRRALARYLLLLRHSLPERIFAALFVIVVLGRAFLAFQVPVDSSDLLRHLGFTAHLDELGFRFYEAEPRDFRREPWSGMWPAQRYVYPPVALMFFSAFSSLGLGIVWIKLAVTLADVASGVLFRVYVSRWAALLALVNPQAVFYGSHEGQFEALQTLAMILTAVAVLHRQWFWAGLAFSLSVQIKLFGALMLPWLLWRVYHEPDVRAAVSRLVVGVAAGVVPFAGFYAHTPDLLLNLGAQRTLFNPFWWDVRDRLHLDWMPVWMFQWMTLVSWAIVALLVVVAARASRRSEWEALAGYLPLLGFWSILKTTAWAQLWYALAAYGLIFCCLDRRRLIHALLALHLILCPRSVMLLSGQEPFGHHESERTQELLRRCRFTCDLTR
jgi:hypothetical protein